MEVPVPGQKDMNNCSSDHANYVSWQVREE